jgi:4a-hydroxytetrahydrobiopterin dehydratase
MQAIDSSQLTDALNTLPGWKGSVEGISKQFVFSDFTEAFTFLTRVAFLAEAQAHHPEIANVYNKVSLTLRTHDAGDKVTSLDLKLASAIEALSG